MQKCNKLLNNIVVYLYSNCCLKKIGPTPCLQLMAHQKTIFFVMRRRCSKNVRVLRTQNTVILRIHMAI